jgi:hypothetical protein
MDNTTFEELVKKTEEEKFYDFVNGQITEIRRYLEIDLNNITLDQLNRKLANYSIVHVSLLSLKTFANSELKKKKFEFDMWYAEKFVFIRSRENRIDLSAQKWLGQKEIEYMMFSEFKEEYKKYHSEFQSIDEKMNFLDGLIKAWETHNFALGSISKNLQIEASIATGNFS